MAFLPHIPDRLIKIRALVFVVIIAAACSVYLLVQADGESYMNVKSVVYINSDPIESLVRLPSIGYETAVKIVEYRESFGDEDAFRCVDDLCKVEGIGTKSAESIEPYISFE